MCLDAALYIHVAGTCCLSVKLARGNLFPATLPDSVCVAVLVEQNDDAFSETRSSTSIDKRNDSQCIDGKCAILCTSICVRLHGGLCCHRLSHKACCNCWSCWYYRSADCTPWLCSILTQQEPVTITKELQLTAWRHIYQCT